MTFMLLLVLRLYAGDRALVGSLLVGSLDQRVEKWAPKKRPSLRCGKTP